MESDGRMVGVLSHLRRAASVLEQAWGPLLFAVAAVAVTVHVPYVNAPPIRSDGLGYHAWTRALLDRDLSFCGSPELEAVQAVSPPDPVTSRCADKYPPFLALLRFPVMAPFTAANHGAWRSPAEDAVDQWFAVVAGTVAVASVVLAGRRLRFRPLGTNLAAAGVGFGMGVFHYATYDSSFTHVHSAALVGLLVLVGLDLFVVDGGSFESRSRRSLLWLFALCTALSTFLVGIHLPSTLVLGSMIACLAILRPDALRTGARRGFVAGACLIAIGTVTSFQLLYDRYVFRRWTISSYAGEHFDIRQLKELPLLFGFERGLFSWFPIIAVALLATVAARQWRLLLCGAVCILPLTVLYGSWHSWNLAAGLGHRGFVELAPLVGLALACSMNASRGATGHALAAATVLATVMTTGLLVAYWNGSANYGEITRAEWIRFAVGRDSFLPALWRWFRR